MTAPVGVPPAVAQLPPLAVPVVAITRLVEDTATQLPSAAPPAVCVLQLALL